MNRRYPFWAPIFAALLVLFLLSKPGATNEEEMDGGETVSGESKGKAFVVTLFEEGPMLRFEVVFTKERR